MRTPFLFASCRLFNKDRLDLMKLITRKGHIMDNDSKYFSIEYIPEVITQNSSSPLEVRIPTISTEKIHPFLTFTFLFFIASIPSLCRVHIIIHVVSCILYHWLSIWSEVKLTVGTCAYRISYIKIIISYIQIFAGNHNQLTWDRW